MKSVKTELLLGISSLLRIIHISNFNAGTKDKGKLFPNISRSGNIITFTGL